VTHCILKKNSTVWELRSSLLFIGFCLLSQGLLHPLQHFKFKLRISLIVFFCVWNSCYFATLFWHFNVNVIMRIKYSNQFPLQIFFPLWSWLIWGITLPLHGLSILQASVLEVGPGSWSHWISDTSSISPRSLTRKHLVYPVRSPGKQTLEHYTINKIEQ